MAFYSVKPRARSLTKRPEAAPGPDPYKPGSKDYAERHRETRRETPAGFIRVDLGEPIEP